MVINKANVHIVGAGQDNTLIVGTKGDASRTTLEVSAGGTGVVVEDVNVTRDGNNVADWNDANGLLNNQGVAIYGAGVTLKESKVVGNRNGVFLYGAQNVSILNNTIDNNRTGVHLVNNVTGLQIKNNFITNNWTMGVLVRDEASPNPTGVITVTENNISGNWYSQIEARSLFNAPAFDMTSNWLGTTTPTVLNAASSGEEGYSTQIPVVYGGTSVAPASSTTVVYGLGNAANPVDYDPFLCSGTDTSSDIGFQNNILDCVTPTVPVNGQPHNQYKNTNDFYFVWDASTDASPITYEFQSSLSPNQAGGVLNTNVWHNSSGSPEQQNLTTPTIHSVGAPDGVWYWQVRAKDASGNTSAWSEIWNVTLDTIKPTVPANGQPHNQVLATHDFTFTWDDSTDASPVTYDWEMSYSDATSGPDNAFVSQAILHTSLVSSEVYSPGTPDNLYYWHVRAVDAAGNKSAWATPWNVTVDTVAPTADLVFPTPGLNSSNYFDVVFSESVQEADAENAANYYLNNWPGAGGTGDLVGDATIVYDNTTKTARVTFTSSAWYISAEQEWRVSNVRDLGGNVIAPNPTSELSSPNVAPLAPGTPTTTTPTTSTTQTWTWAAAVDPGGSAASGVARYEVSVDGGAWASVGNTLSTNTSFTSGTHTLKVRAIDNAGNVGAESSAGSVTVNVVVPPVVLGSKDACKNGGWATSTLPVFKNQGDCVSYFTAQNAKKVVITVLSLIVKLLKSIYN